MLRLIWPVIRSVAGGRFASVVLLCAVAGTCLSADGDAKQLVVVSPVSGSKVVAGCDVPFHVEADPSLMPGVLHILSWKMMQNGPVGGTFPGGPTYKGTMFIPPDRDGPFSINVALLKPRGGGLIRGTSIQITLNAVAGKCERDERAAEARAESSAMISDEDCTGDCVCGGMMAYSGPQDTTNWASTDWAARKGVLQQIGLTKEGWHVVWLVAPDSETTYLFFSSDPMRSKPVKAWIGTTTRSERREMKEWIVHNVPGVPIPLAECFAYIQTKG